MKQCGKLDQQCAIMSTFMPGSLALTVTKQQALSSKAPWQKRCNYLPELASDCHCTAAYSIPSASMQVIC
jgi:hypothetical protein